MFRAWWIACLFSILTAASAWASPGGASCARGAYCNDDESAMLLDDPVPQAVAMPGGVKRLRVEGYGNTIIRFHAKSSNGRLKIGIEGPVPFPGDAADFPKCDACNLHHNFWSGNYSVNLPAPGVYRIVFSDSGESERRSLAHDEARLTVSGAHCVEWLNGWGVAVNACHRRSILPSELFRRLDALIGPEAGKTHLDYLRDEISNEASRVFSGNPILKQTALAQIQAYYRDVRGRLPDLQPYYGKVDRPLPLPVKRIEALREAFEALHSSDKAGASPAPAPTEAPLSGSLEERLSSCDVPRTEPSKLSKYLPELVMNGSPDYAFSLCEVAASNALADVLTKLSDHQGSISYHGKTYTEASDLIAALIRSGHHVDVRSEHMYADFFAIDYVNADGTRDDVIWPAWLDTGVNVKTRSGESHSLAIPAGHSQHVWTIRGPEVNARVAFFLGITGVGFYPDVGRRASWNGHGISYLATSEANVDFVVQSIEASAHYQRVIKAEAATDQLHSMPGNAYGFVGICNDSTAVVAQALRPQLLPGLYPLLRPSSLSQSPAATGDPLLRAAFAALPHDSEESEDRPADETLYRIWAMSPFADPAHAPALWDTRLREDMEFVRRAAKAYAPR